MALFQRQGTGNDQCRPQGSGCTTLVAFGAFFAAVLGISASLFAVQHAEIGVASTLMALPPVFMLPLSYFVFKERFNWQAVAGTLVAIAAWRFYS